MLSIVEQNESTEIPMTLTDHYLDMDIDDVYVYFSSDSFGPDSKNSDAKFWGWHGYALAQWIRAKALVHGFKLSEPSDCFTHWNMVLTLNDTKWDVNCENLERGFTDRWKISIINLDKSTDTTREDSSPFCFFCRDALFNAKEIDLIEWNIVELNNTELIVDEVVY